MSVNTVVAGSPELPVPPEALGQHTAIMGKTGSGKTYAAKSLVEWLLEQGRRVCVIDPTGVWFGLRSSSDGKHAGYPVAILGGPHGDSELPPESGAACARLVAEQSLQVVFDTTAMSVGERTRWFAAFGAELFRRNSKPLHLTASGRACVTARLADATLAELHQRALGVLRSKSLAKILSVLLHARGRELGRTEVAERAGFEPGSGTFAKYCSKLRSFGVIVYPRKTTMAAAPWLFPSGLS